MTYKVRVRPRDVEIEFETGSISEAVGILQDEANAIGELFAAAPWATSGQEQGTSAPPPVATPAKPGRKPRNAPDPASASAPPPLPVTAPPAPAAPPAPPMPPSMAPPTAPDDTSIPPFLRRPDAAPPAPPVVGGRLGPLVKSELDKRATDDAAKGQIVAWLVQSGVLLGTPVPTWNEATAVLTVATDKELESVAGALGIS